MKKDKNKPMICPDCDGRGYIKENDKSKRCKLCEGEGILFSKEIDNSEKNKNL